MKANVSVDAGICGFHTKIMSVSEDGQTVEFQIETGCEKIKALAQALKEKEPVDAYQEISPTGESVVLSVVRSTLKGCCAGCAVPVGLFKAMQIAAGLALPKDIMITISKEG
ncbi:MAG: hypothetical protein WC975_06305 [Phycisphaerae bacterium]